MTLYKLTEFCNGNEGISNIYLTKELAEARASRPTRSESLRMVDGKYHMVPNVYTYVIEPFEWDKEIIFDVYVSDPKGMYTTARGKRKSGLTYDEALKSYDDYSKDKYVDLQLPQTQFGGTGITKIKSNRDDSYWKAQKAWEEEQKQDPDNYPENEPFWRR